MTNHPMRSVMSKKKKHEVRSLGLHGTFGWFQLARPEPTSKQFHTQLGVHFEEVGEMIDTISPDAPSASALLHDANMAIKALAKYLKASDRVVTIERVARIDFLDALCDQIVTATGIGQHCGFDILNALNEVNASNWSKFVDGLPIVDANQKIMKGPDYFKADLAPYIPSRIPALLD